MIPRKHFQYRYANDGVPSGYTRMTETEAPTVICPSPSLLQYDAEYQGFKAFDPFLTICIPNDPHACARRRYLQKNRHILRRSAARRNRPRNHILRQQCPFCPPVKAKTPSTEYFCFRRLCPNPTGTANFAKGQEQLTQRTVGYNPRTWEAWTADRKDILFSSFSFSSSTRLYIQIAFAFPPMESFVLNDQLRENPKRDADDET